MPKFCSKCGAQLSNTAEFCPYCGQRIIVPENAQEKKAPKKGKNVKRAKQPKQPKQQKNGRGVLLGILIAIFIVGIITLAGILVISHFEVNEIVASLMSDDTSENESYSGINALGNQFTDRLITDENSAIAAAQDVAETLGYKNAFDELESYVSTTVDDESYYRLQQYYEGIPVYGRYVNVAVDSNGEAISLITDVLDIPSDISLTPDVTIDQIKARIKKYAEDNLGEVYDDINIPELSDDYLVIYDLDEDDTAHLAYALTWADGSGYTVVADAHDGEVLECISIVCGISSTGTNADGTLEVPVIYNAESDTYTMYDEVRNIYIGNMNGENSDDNNAGSNLSLVISIGDNIFGNTDEERENEADDAANIFSSVEKIADYLYDSFGQDIPYNKIYILYNDSYDFGYNVRGGGYGTFGLIYFGENMDATESEILAHEYTHILEAYYDAARSEDNGICEGIADTFSCFYQIVILDEQDWDIDLPLFGHRNAIDPSGDGYPSTINSKFNLIGDDDKHWYATVISHAAYLMYDSGEFTIDELQLLWYKTFIQLPHDCSYSDLRYIMEKMTSCLDYSEKQQEAIENAFDRVGIYDSVTYKCSNSININVYDLQENLYNNYTVKIEGKTSEGWFGIGSKEYFETYEQKSAETLKIELEKGEYTITITDNANDTIYWIASVKVKKSYDKDYLDVYGFGISIPSDAVEYNGHYYYFVTDDDVTWTEAKAICESMGGYLATITSEEEQEFINEYSSQYFDSDAYLWIGGYREDDETVWMWVTGEAWDYTNWDSGEPNNSSSVVSNENRIVLWSGGYWNDLNDENTGESSGYICEWEEYATAAASETTTEPAMESASPLDLYNQALQQLESYDSFTLDMNMTMDMDIVGAGSSENAVVEYIITCQIENYGTDDLYAKGSGTITGGGLNYAYKMSYENGIMNYSYTKPMVMSASVEMEFDLIPSEIANEESIIRSSSTTEDGSLVIVFVIDGGNRLSDIEDLFGSYIDFSAYEDISLDKIEMTVTMDSDALKLESIAFEYEMDMEYSGYDVTTECVAVYEFTYPD